MIALSGLDPAVLSAERMNGTIVPLGHYYAPIINANSMVARLHCSLQPHHPDVIFSGLTAAWVWGALRDAPARMEYSVRANKRISIRTQIPHIKREMQFSSSDVVRIGPFEVTSPLRTVFDLVQSSAPMTVEMRVACRLLLLREDSARKKILHTLKNKPRTPHATRVREQIMLI